MADRIEGAEATIASARARGLRGGDFWRVRGGRIQISFGHSPLARKIIVLNITAILVMVAGVLHLNPFRDSLVIQRETAMLREMVLISDLTEARLADGGSGAGAAIQGVRLSAGAALYAFDPAGRLLGQSENAEPPARLPTQDRSTVMMDFLTGIWGWLSEHLLRREELPKRDTLSVARALADMLQDGGAAATTSRDASGATIFSVARAIEREGQIIAVLALTSAAGEIDDLVRIEREQVLQVFVIAIIVSIGLSLILASAIATPLAELARAAEAGQDPKARRMTSARVRIPDLRARADEIGRLSEAMRRMVDALYERIDANEQFAADVAHEIKNPLASLRSAVASLDRVTRKDQRARLLQVIDSDVRRLDRLVSDISNASRLDSELVKEEEEIFDLVRMVSDLCAYFAEQAQDHGISFIADLPEDRIGISGLEGRLAQVFVNLITNALSFCDAGGTVRVWVRRRDNRVVVVVEDTGPGIPEEALTRVFRRFYSQRPEGQFGDHSGLGLAISKQIVEAHGGVIWAENIRPPDADPLSPPLGARFVVGLPA
ncbi:ATP-binding protein [Paenirhodobacter sp.]|uniref:ATP-binding protein n=1 Tax=Paenirhodobacter sp. TaxID=1965326 RepID=UPI003B40D382